MDMKIKGILEGTQPERLMASLLSLASDWGDVLDTSKLKAIHLSGAMTNVVYRISWPKNTVETDERTVLVRVYGEVSYIFFDREEEIRTFEWISARGIGPRLLARFPRGRVEEFIHAKTLSAFDLRDPEISKLIAAKVREFHDLNMPGAKSVVLWPTLRKWLSKARSLCSQEHAKEFQLDILENEIDTLENKLSIHDQDISFCHNDLQYGNIMIDEKTRTVTLIDYEFAGYNPVAYDLAYHFCEWAANYHNDTPHILDYNMYPGFEERKRFVQSYLSSKGFEERKRFVQSYLSSKGNEPCDTEVDQLIDDVEKYTLASHLNGGLWAIISGYVTHIDFDYIKYAKQRFSQYWLKKPQLLKE